MSDPFHAIQGTRRELSRVSERGTDWVDPRGYRLVFPSYTCTPVDSTCNHVVTHYWEYPTKKNGALQIIWLIHSPVLSDIRSVHLPFQYNLCNETVKFVLSNG